MESMQQNPNKIIDTRKTEKQERLTRTESQRYNNRKITHPNHTEQTGHKNQNNEYRDYKENYVWKED